jgi:hypothetical protein
MFFMKGMVLLLLLLVAVPAFAGPRIVFEAETHDFGEVAEGVLLVHEFDFLNGGTEELVIEKLTSS